MFSDGWVKGKGPTDIPVNTAIDMTLNWKSSTTGNCTWEYSNSHGKWEFYWNWQIQEFGDQNFGLGTGDDADNAEAELSAPLPILNIVCGVVAYGDDGINFCEASTAPSSAGCDNWG